MEWSLVHQTQSYKNSELVQVVIVSLRLNSPRRSIRTARSSLTPNAIQAATPLPPQSLEHQQPSTLENPPQMKQTLRNRDYSFGERQSTVNEATAVNGSSDTDTLPPLALTSHSGSGPWWRHIERLASLSHEKLLTDFTDLLSLEPRLAENEKTKLKLKLLMLWSSNHIDPIIGGTRSVSDRPSTSKGLKVSLLALYESQGCFFLKVFVHIRRVANY
jgi:hypothetical protein